MAFAYTADAALATRTGINIHENTDFEKWAWLWRASMVPAYRAAECFIIC
jgi:hypothetical protein